MEIPAYVAEEAARRLRLHYPEADLRQMLDLLGLDLAEAGPEPSFDDLSYPSDDSKAESCGCLVVRGEVSALGDQMPLWLRYVYRGEFGFDPEVSDDFAQIGVTARLETLGWDTGARSPRWRSVDITILSPDMQERIDALVLEQERMKFESEA